MSTQDLQTWRDRVYGAVGSSPLWALAIWFFENFRHKDSITIEEHRIQVEQWIEAVKYCQSFYTGGM